MKKTLNKLADEHGYSDKMGNVSGLFEHFELGYTAAQAEIARLKSALDVAVEGLEKYKDIAVESFTADLVYCDVFVASETLAKIKQIRGEGV